jgi:segregation and condensation protein A
MFHDRNEQSFSRKAFLGQREGFYPPENFGAPELHSIFVRIVSEIPIAPQLEQEHMREVMSLEEKISSLHDVLRTRAQVCFSQIVKNHQNPSEVVVSFLALLELVKQSVVNVSQEGAFGEIRMKLEK